MIASGKQFDLPLDPLAVLGRWPADRRIMMLHSGRLHPRWARQSILAEPVGTYRFTATEDGLGHGEWIGSPQSCPVSSPFTDKPFRDLRSLVQAAGDGLWIGCISYDIARWIEKLPTHSTDDRCWPVVEFAYCPGYLRFDAQQRQWAACGSWGAQLPFDLMALPETRGDFDAGEPVSLFTRAGYESAVAKAMEYIAAGDIFQVNLAQRFCASFHGEYPLAQRSLYGRLATLSPAWYGAYMELAGDRGPGRVIASISPELFMEVDAARRAITRPIKGTRPASVDPGELLRSEKDMAELNMIVDLLRNDLGRVCTYGTVSVDEPRTIETHPTIHHGVATISGTLHPTKDMIDLLRAALPGGSITGAPKVRAMQIIDGLEPVRRGPYCGCLGWMSRDSMNLNIAIRTMLLDPAAHRVDFSVGGGIVADSQPAAEYDETIAKAQAMLRAISRSPVPGTVR